MAARQKAAADPAPKKAEEKRQDDLNKHLTQPLFMLTQAGVQFMKDNRDSGKNGKVQYIPGLFYESMEVLLNEVCRIVIYQCGIDNVSARHNIVTRQIIFEWKKGTINFLSFDMITSSTWLNQAGVQFMKDNRDSGMNGKVQYIPGLFYESMEVLLNEVCRIVIYQCGIHNVSARHNIVTGQIIFEWKMGTLKFLSFDMTSSTNWE